MLSPQYKKWALGFLGAFAFGVVAFWYLGGVCWRHESYEVQQSSLLSGSRWGVSLGPRRFYLRKGQTLVLRYEAEVRKGSIDFHFSRSFQPISKWGNGQLRRVLSTGKGKFEMSVPEDGYYRVSTWTMTDRGQCDLSYNATWSLR